MISEQKEKIASLIVEVEEEALQPHHHAHLNLEHQQAGELKGNSVQAQLSLIQTLFLASFSLAAVLEDPVVQH